MTQTHKQLEKSLKAPDQFQKIAVNGLSWLANNPKYVWAALGPIVLVMAAWTGWSYWSKHQSVERQEELGKVEAVYQDELRVVADQAEAIRKQQDALDVQIGKETDTAKKAGLTAQKATLEKSVSNLKPDHSGSLKSYLDFFAKYPSKPEGWAAGMRGSAILLQKKDFAAAKDQLTKLVDASKSENFYQVQGKFMLIGINEELGDNQAALTEAARLEAIVDDKLKPQALLTKARLQLAVDQKEEATKTINQLVEKFASSQEAEKAKTIKALYLGG
jgi:predicted negative regulator of RcsB-dependent stress response